MFQEVNLKSKAIVLLRKPSGNLFEGAPSIPVLAVTY